MLQDGGGSDDLGRIEVILGIAGQGRWTVTAKPRTLERRVQAAIARPQLLDPMVLRLVDNVVVEPLIDDWTGPVSTGRVGMN